MKISDLKITHIILIIAIVLWAYLCFDWQKMKYQLQFEGWRNAVTQSVNNLNTRVTALEKKVKMP
jgi:hypothetical protein